MGLLPNTSNCGCACARNAGNVFPATAGKQSRHASRHVRDARAVMHAGIANSRFPLNSAAGGKRSRHSRRMRNPRFYVSGKRPMVPSFQHSVTYCSCPPPEAMLYLVFTQLRPNHLYYPFQI